MSFVGGGTDASTYTAADRLFSTHITGNLIVFAYKITSGIQLTDVVHLHLISLPVFILSILTTAKINIHLKSERKLVIILILSLILCFASIISHLIRNGLIVSEFIYQSTLMLFVFAMGMQNSVNKIYNKSTYGFTTTTGNMLKTFLDLAHYMDKRKFSKELKIVKNTSFLIIFFMLGCILGALSSRFLD